VRLDEARRALQGRRVLVTGGGGFVGGRLVERLVEECGAEVRVLVRNLSGAMRLARYPLDFRRGDVLDAASLAAATAGCDVVFHCAYGTSGSQRARARVNRDGTRRVLEAAAAARCRRLVHLSTLMVYGRTSDGDLDERAPRRRFGNAYADSKLDAERLALAASRRGALETVVLQPTAVFGPYGGVWTERVLGAMKSGRQILVDGGSGLANFVYVDDLVSAMLQASIAGDAAGEAFLISAREPVTWREWFGRFERILGGERTISMSAEAARRHWRAAQRARPRALGELLSALRGDRALRERLFETPELRALREAASATLPEAWQRRIKARLGMGAAAMAPRLPAAAQLPITPLRPSEIDFFLPRTRVRIDRAERVLGYRPAFDLEAGMELTEAWARWADLA
jgi:nucleoside-diphosphate-sugar epimerase